MPAPLPTDLALRRVGFRHGTDDELAALHRVEAAVEAERRPDRLPQPVESYIAFARNLPARFHDHTWLVETAAGDPVASGACWSDAAGDARVMHCDLFVRADHRRRGVGSHLLATICDECDAEERTLLVWQTFATVPAGDHFSRGVGATVARVNRTSELALGAIDWDMVERWIAEGADRAPGYRLEWVDGAFPEHLRDDAAAFHHIMQTAPKDDLDVGDVRVTAADIEDVDRALAESGRDRWTILVRGPDDACVGGTEVQFEPWDPASGFQQNTGIDPVHRGRGLAKWAKAAMLERIRRERPEVARIRTGNAFSNAAMLAINDTLGFQVIDSSTEWQAAVATVRDALARRGGGAGGEREV